MSSLTGQTVLVTGGTGFIGARLIEKLVREHQANVRVLVHQIANASRVARFDVELATGDITDAAEMASAVADCRYVFHCAFGKHGDENEQRRVTVDGTQTLARAACAANVERFIALSTLAVYGAPQAGTLTEASPRQPDDAYGRSKLAADKALLELHRNAGLKATILQPTFVYGPYGPFWTVDPLRQLKSGTVMLPANGQGLCNAVYVDDVADAMIAAGEHADAIGEQFLISGAEPVTWLEFYQAYAAMLDGAVIDFFEAATAGAVSRRDRLLASPTIVPLYRSLKRLLPARLIARLKRDVLGGDAEWQDDPSDGDGARPVHVPSERRTRVLTSTMRVDITKARRLIGYEPQFDLTSGMARTRQWSAWANLL